MASSEAETTIVYDYDGGTVNFYTTRYGERNNVLRRMGEENCRIKAHINDGKEVAWTIVMDLEHCRNPYYVTPIMSDD